MFKKKSLIHLLISIMFVVCVFTTYSYSNNKPKSVEQLRIEKKVKLIERRISGINNWFLLHKAKNDAATKKLKIKKEAQKEALLERQKELLKKLKK